VPRPLGECGTDGADLAELQPFWIRLPIDQIMTRGALTRLDFKSGFYIGSDHLPVEAEIAVKPE